MAYEGKRGRGALSEYEGSGMPLAEPQRIRQDSMNAGDDRPKLPWLLDSEEEAERDNLISKIRVGLVLIPTEKARLAYLCTKRGLKDATDSGAKLITDSGHIPFTPR